MENQNSVPLAGGKKGTKSKNTKFILALAALGVIIIVVVILLVVLLPKNGQSEEESEVSGEETSVIEYGEEVQAQEQRVTEETLANIVDVNIEGYKKVDDNEISSDIVAVSIKNKSDQKVSIEVIIGAYGENGDLLETSALYAESAEPGVTQEFQLFAYTNLTPEQLQNATYKVYKAATYEPDSDEGTTEVFEDPEDESSLEE